MFDRRKIKYTYLKLSKEIKNFLLSQKSREFLIFLFFFFVASSFWLLQTLNNDYEAEFDIPVRLKGLPQNVVLTSEPPSELRVKVKDKGTVLLNYLLGKSFFPVTLDFSNYAAKNDRVIIMASEFEKNIQNQLNISTRLLAIQPDTLEYIYATGDSKWVPVQLTGKVNAAAQYYIPDTLFTPDSVLVYAPKNLLNDITIAYTKPVQVENLTDTLKQRVLLDPIKGAKFVPNAIEFMLPVDIYTEKTVSVPLYGTNFPADKTLRAFPSSVNVTFQVGVSRFSKITANDFLISVSYEELLNLGSAPYTVKLKNKPKGISHIRISPPQVDFLIEQISSNEY